MTQRLEFIGDTTILTSREQEIMILRASGLSNQEVGDQLGIVSATAANQLKNAFSTMQGQFGRRPENLVDAIAMLIEADWAQWVDVE